MNESKKSQDRSYFHNYHPNENHTQASKSLKSIISACSFRFSKKLVKLS